jgi:hypothetical protein
VRRLDRIACLAALVASAALADCTFPDVQYDDAGTTTTTTTTGECMLPATCAADAQTCGDSARTKLKGCQNPCKNDPTCIADCDSKLQQQLTSCAAVCESCAGCTPNTCAAVVGQ